MISHEHRVIFVHVPKTAGTSIESALGHHGAGGVQRGMQDHRTLRQLLWPGGGIGQISSASNCRETARALKGRVRPGTYPANRLTVSRAQFESYFKFAVVRNPWARAYSCYVNVRSDDLHRARLGVAPDASLADFLEACLGTDMLRPQMHWLVDFRGRIRLDQLCYFETLESDFAQVCRRAGLPATRLPCLNVGHGDYLEAYDDRSRQLVAQRCRLEIEAMGYTFDGAPERRRRVTGS